MDVIGVAFQRKAVPLPAGEQVNGQRPRVPLRMGEKDGFISLLPSAIESKATDRSHFIRKIHLYLHSMKLSLPL
jgi:hypothetical protein